MAQNPDVQPRILPTLGQRNVLVTSALPPVTKLPHLGDIVSGVLSADVFARYCKARGYSTLFICGTADYGAATEMKAIKEGLTPAQICNKYSALHEECYAWFNIGFDYFGQTSNVLHNSIVSDICVTLSNRGYLGKSTTSQPYCEKHESPLADHFIEGICPFCDYGCARGDQCDQCGTLIDAFELKTPRCKLDGNTPIQRMTDTIYLLLPKLKRNIHNHFHTSGLKGKVPWSPNSINITLRWLQNGLEDLNITRDFNWGIKPPFAGYHEKRLHSRFDACIGYLSITANYTKEWEKWWRDPKVQLYQFMRKDDVPFHSVIFAGSLAGTGHDNWTPIHHISATEYLNYEEDKFSESRNVGVFGNTAKDTGIPSDVWRYYLLSHRPENQDTSFEWKAFIHSNNNELVKNLDSFVHRVISFLNGKHYESVIPDYTQCTDVRFDCWVTEVNEELQGYIEGFETVKLRAALAHVIQISSLGGQLLDCCAFDDSFATEWPRECAAVIGCAVNLVHLLASLTEPFLPVTSASILRQLNLNTIEIPNEWSPGSVPVSHTIGIAEHLFFHISPSKEIEWKEMFGGDAAKAPRVAQEEHWRYSRQQPGHACE